MNAARGSKTPVRPVTLLIAALGGEGGGVLADWIVQAAAAEGYPVQSTSIPGVAQRTGATTYYIEIFPVKTEDLGGRDPVLALYPSPGHVDVMLASELMEAGRAMENGFIDPDRTTLIASNHRVYAIAEKSAMGDGIRDGAPIIGAASELARWAILFDFAALARREGVAINAVLLGALAGADVLPMPSKALEQAVRAAGIAVESNLKGFAAGRAGVQGKSRISSEEVSPPQDPPALPSALAETIRADFPEACQSLLEPGARRLIDYQDDRYATTYLERLRPVLDADRAAEGATRGFELTREVGRYLALWMSYEDVIRVADLKSRRVRFEAVRAEAGAKTNEPVRITEFLKPGVEEIAALLPPALGRPLLSWADRTNLRERLRWSMRVRSDGIIGLLKLRLLAGLKGWRRRSLRFAEEQALIRRWLDSVTSAARQDYELALEVAACANLLKGYGETQQRGRRNFQRIYEEIIFPALGSDETGLAAKLRQARELALTHGPG